MLHRTRDNDHCDCQANSAAVLRLLAVMAALGASETTEGKIVKTRTAPSETWNPFLPLTVGLNLEYETNNEQTQYDMPMLVEYNFNEQFKLTLEPDYLVIDGKAKDVKSVSGWGDTETSFEYEFIRERRYRPAITFEGTIKWPTAEHTDLGNPGIDYSLGLIASKDFVTFDLDFSALYTFSGDPEQEDTLELSLAGEYPLNYRFSLIGEVVQTFGTGMGGMGHDPTVDQTEVTLGFSWQINTSLKYEQGVLLRNDGTWQLLFGFEWSFAGED